MPEVLDVPGRPKKSLVVAAPYTLKRQNRMVGEVKEKMLKRTLPDIQREREPSRKKKVSFKEPLKLSDPVPDLFTPQPTPQAITIQPSFPVPSTSRLGVEILKISSKFSFKVRASRKTVAVKVYRLRIKIERN